MTWWSWVLIWVVLVLAAVAVLAVLGLSLWRRVKLLLSELGTASDRLAAVTDRLAENAPGRVRADPAVFTAPLELRQEQFLTRRARGGRRSAERS